MKTFTTLFLFGVIFLCTAFIYENSLAACRYPVTYRIGEISEGFTITEEEALTVIDEAVAPWEEVIGADVFVYDETSDFTVNFVYDERQARSEAESGFREKLNNAEDVNQQIKDQYNSLVQQYEALNESYDRDRMAFEQSLQVYNDKVNRYNQEGGVSPEVYEELEEEREDLDSEQSKLNKRADELSGLVDQINQVSQQGNKLIDQYNKGAERYNETFGESRQFTQGDYQGDKINIYTYENFDELRLVLSHEFGHAIDIGHVEGEQSVMYYLIGEQSPSLTLTEQDKDAARTLCTDKPWWDRLSYKVYLMFANLL